VLKLVPSSHSRSFLVCHFVLIFR